MRVLAGIGIASGVLANAALVASFLISRSESQGAPTTRDYALGCGMLVAAGMAVGLVLLGGVCSGIALADAHRRKQSPVPAVVGLVLNLLPISATLVGGVFGR